jgi:hypothetical protein
MLASEGDGILGGVVSAAMNSASVDDLYGRLLRAHTATYVRRLPHRWRVVGLGSLEGLLAKHGGVGHVRSSGEPSGLP